MKRIVIWLLLASICGCRFKFPDVPMEENYHHPSNDEFYSHILDMGNGFEGFFMQDSRGHWSAIISHGEGLYQRIDLKETLRYDVSQ